MIIEEYSTIFRGKTEDWRTEWSYPKAWGSGSGSNNDLNSYLNYIKDLAKSNRYINTFIRTYMEKTEVRYPRYHLYMMEYLDMEVLD